MIYNRYFHAEGYENTQEQNKCVAWDHGEEERVGGRVACQNRWSHSSVLRRIAGRRLTFLRLAIKLQKENAAVLRPFVRPSAGSGSTRKKSNVVGSLPPIPSRPSFGR